jgi:hypothetical protein
VCYQEATKFKKKINGAIRCGTEEQDPRWTCGGSGDTGSTSRGHVLKCRTWSRGRHDPREARKTFLTKIKIEIRSKI